MNFGRRDALVVAPCALTAAKSRLDQISSFNRNPTIKTQSNHSRPAEEPVKKSVELLPAWT
jgi:hypothetical protein